MQALHYRPRPRLASTVRALLLGLCLVVVTAVASPPEQEPLPAGLRREYHQHARRFHRARRHRVAERALPKVQREWRQR